MLLIRQRHKELEFVISEKSNSEKFQQILSARTVSESRNQSSFPSHLLNKEALRIEHMDTIRSNYSSRKLCYFSAELSYLSLLTCSQLKVETKFVWMQPYSLFKYILYMAAKLSMTACLLWISALWELSDTVH